MRGKRVTKEEFIKKAKGIHDNKYDYGFVDFLNMSSKVCIVCPNHGEFFQTPVNHINQKQGCPSCAASNNSKKRSISAQNVELRAKSKHGDKYSIIDKTFSALNSKISALCKHHGEFVTQPRFLYEGDPCPLCKEQRGIGKKKYLTPTTKDNFIERSRATHGDKYDYSKSVFKGVRNKIEIICQKHGSFFQKTYNHINGSGCTKCGWEVNRKPLKSNDEFINQCIDRHGDKFDYSKTQYTKSTNEVTITCPKHGDFKKIARDFINASPHGCPMCAHTTSDFEINIRKYLQKFDIKLETRTKKVIAPQELDIYCPEKKIAVECDGIYWHSELQGKGKGYHLNKTNLCSDKGIRLIHIFENEFIYKDKIVKSRLKNIFNLNKYKIFARKCRVEEVDSKTKDKFLDKYHIQGNDRSLIKLGLFYKSRLVAVMTFCKNRKALGKSHINGEWELSRFATIANFSIVGGAGKLLKYFEKKWQPIKITSYADKRWSEGGLYFKLGFNKARDSKPNYWYFKGYKSQLTHRFVFRKSELSKKLDKFNPNKTEWRNMKENGWNRIWDCGNLVFEKIFN